jgi:hypothetical protein
MEKFFHELNALWKLSGRSMGALRELVAVAGINEFIDKEQGTDDVSHTSKILQVAENNVILDNPQKLKTMFQFETPDTSHQRLRRFKHTFLFYTSSLGSESLSLNSE